MLRKYHFCDKNAKNISENFSENISDDTICSKIKTNDKKSELKTIRKKQLTKYFNENNLEVKTYGDCYSYINNGYPPLNEIINNELNKKKIIDEKKCELINELTKINVPFDNNCNICYEYTNSIGCRSLRDAIRLIEINYFLKTKTNYDQYIKLYNKDLAQEYAIRHYISSLTTKDSNIINIVKNIKEDVTIEFD